MVAFDRDANEQVLAGRSGCGRSDPNPLGKGVREVTREAGRDEIVGPKGNR